MDKKLEKEFEETIKKDEEAEKTEQELKDEKKANEIFFGRKEVYLKDVGWLVFDWPNYDQNFEAEKIYAQAVNRGLREGTYNNREQLRVLYRKDGVWTEAEDNRIDEISSEIENKIEIFTDYRTEIQDLENQLLEKKGDKALKRGLEKKYEEAKELYIEIAKLKLEFAKLNARFIQLFNVALEEVALLEKARYLAPHCVYKKDGDNLVPLWKDLDDLKQSKGPTLKIMGYFVLFLRGADVSFFGDTPETAETS